MLMTVTTKAKAARTINIWKSRGCNGDAGSLCVAVSRLSPPLSLT